MIKEEDFIPHTRTTGFGSPARAYVEKRLSPNDLLIDDVHTTYFFQWDGDDKFGLCKGDYLVVDRAKVPTGDDIVVWSGSQKLEISRFSDIQADKLWGTVTWKLCQLKKSSL